MSKSNKNIEEIRKMLKDLKSKKYEIVNPDLVELDEYIKSLYIKVLCTVVQYENDPTDMQILFLKRIINGIGVEDSVEEYMRKALEISEQDIQEFLSIVGDSKIKYYFATDGLILLSIGSNNSKGYEYLAELIELLGINKDDLEYLCTVAKSIIQQKSSFYDEAKGMINERVKNLNFKPYIQNYYAGAIVDSKAMVCYSAPERKLSSEIVYRAKYTENKVVFNNLDMNISQELKFEACEEVIFENCKISGSKFSILFSSCKKIVLRQCRFENFTVAVLKEEENEDFLIEDCEFENCFTVYKRKSNNWQVLGGVIYCDNASRNAKNMIKNTTFKNCGGKNRYNCFSSAVISNCMCNVIRCSFYNCWNYNTNGNLVVDPEYYRRTLFIPGTKGTKNKIIGSAKFC